MASVQNIGIWILIKVTGLDENAEREFGGKMIQNKKVYTDNGTSRQLNM